MPTEEYLRFFRFLIDIAAEIFRNLAEHSLLENNKISFIQFLEKEKHYFFHEHGQEKLCCQCKDGLSIIPRRKIEHKLFTKVYSFDRKKSIKNHKVTKNGKITQRCIHGMYANKEVTLDNLDLSALSYFLLTKGNLSSEETSAIRIVMEARSIICHSPSTSSIGSNDLSNMWKQLEVAILKLSKPKRYKNMVQMNINNFREKQDKVNLLMK